MINKILIVLLGLGSYASSALASSKHILFVVTGASELKLNNGEIYKSGYWLEEFSVPYEIFEKNGFQISIATPKGNIPTVDHGSAAVDENGKPLYWQTKAELDHALSIKKRVLDEGRVLSLTQITNKDLEKFDAVFFPGGHGPMADMLKGSEVARVLMHFHKKKKDTALVCHAPAVLTSTVAKNKFPYRGYRLTAFTDEEEGQTPIGPKMTTTPQKELSKAGASFVSKPAWQVHVVEDRELITGQNPASSKAIAETLVRRLKAK